LLSIIVVAVGVMGLCVIILHRERVRAMPPFDAGVSLAELGFRPGEGLRAHAVGELLFTDEIDIVGREPNTAAGALPSHVKTALTTDDRLLVEVNGHCTWFSAAARPNIRPVGRIMVRDTTSVLDMLAGRSETAVYYIPDGYPTPEGATAKVIESAPGVVQEVYVLELTVAGRPPLRFEAVRSTAMALCQWSRSRSVPPVQTPSIATVAFEDTLRSRRNDELSRAS
jgi:hypothetical protein